MSDQKRNWLLQLFGEEEAGEAPGEEAADAGQDKLRELGVPEEKLKKNPAKPETETRARLSWEEIRKDPEYNARIQKIVRSRLRDQGQARAALEALEPALRQLAAEHGLDPEHLDHAALARKITEGAPTPEQLRAREHSRFRSHIRGLHQQGQAMKQQLPDFDLRQELRNPLFARLTSPAVGLSVEDAFYTVHRRQLQQQTLEAASRKTREMISNAIQSGIQRPREAGADAQGPSLTRFDYRSASPEQRQALKNEIRRAAAEGRKVYPG